MTHACACHTGPYTPCDYPGGCGTPGGCCATDQQPVPRCVVCHRKLKEGEQGPICQACHNRASNQLAEIPSLLDRLAYNAVTGSPGIVEFVSGGAFASRPPVRLDALSLTVYTPDAIGLELTDPRPPAGAAGDSIPLWTISWAAVWRSRFGHHQPASVRAPQPARTVTRSESQPRRSERAVNEPMRRCALTDLPPDMCAHCRKISDPAVEAETHTPLEGPAAPTPREPAEYAAVVAAQLEERSRHTRHMARVILGLEVARAVHGGKANTRDPNVWRRIRHDGDDDALAEHWTTRFGPARQIRRIMTDLAYLATWLDLALEQFDDADQFIVGLRSLIAAARSTIGERSDVVYLGQCPETLLDRETGEEVLCGARLARDPMVSVVICPRCRTETTERGLLMLARRMRDVYGQSAEREAWTS